MRNGAVLLGLVFVGGVSVGEVLLPEYTITDLGQYVQPQAINGSGDIAGSELSQGILWQRGEWYEFENGKAWGINNCGQVVGVCGNQAVVWDGGTVAPLMSTASFARDINDSGQIVGYLSSGAVQACLWQGGAVTVLPTGAGWQSSVANGINAHGQIVGTGTTIGGKMSAMLWESGSLRVITNSIGGNNVNNNAFAEDINDSGQVVGYANTGELIAGMAINHAFIWEGSDMIDLGTLVGHDTSTAFGVNEKGQVVGGSSSLNFSSPDTRAYLYSEGMMYDLKTLLPEGSGWQRLQCAYDINDSGQVVGMGLLENGEWHGFLMTPIPEPATLLLLGAGAVVVGRCRKGGRSGVGE